jgi:hypothetical protein
MSWIENLDLDLAWQRVIKDMGDDPYPDILHYKDVQLKWENFRDDLLGRIGGDGGTYHPEPYKTIEIPKRGFTLRPAGAMHIKDRLLYQAIADFLAPHFTPEQPVYSFRLASPKSPWMFLQGVEQWKLFEAEAERLCHEYQYVLETDLTAYFEHIDHRRLARRLDDIFPGIDRATMRALKQHLSSLLCTWSRNTTFGIPQVNNPSSFFGNMYLDEFDKLLIRSGFTYLRYVDDMRVFVNSIPDARKALAQIGEALRRSGLYLSSGKTRIVPSELVIRELDSGRNTLNQVDEAFKSKSRSRIEEVLPNLQEFFFSTIRDENDFRDRHFRFCIYRYRKLKAFGIGGDIHRPVVETVLDKLYNLPSATDVFALYLSLFPGVTDIPVGILNFLESDFNIYAWQEMHLLEVLIRILSPIESPITERAKRYARTKCQSRDAHPCVRAKANILLGKIGDWADRRNIRDSYYGENDIEVQKAILIAIQEMNTEERRNFYRNAQNGNEEIKCVVDYLSNLDHPRYHYFNPPDPEDFVDEDILRLEDDIDYEEIWY